MKKRLFFACLTAVVAVLGGILASCDSEESVLGGNNQAISIDIVKDDFGGVNTRSTTTGLVTTITSGDAAGVYTLDASNKVVAANVKATYNGSSWSLASAIPYSTSYKYYAYFPYKSSPSGGPAAGNTLSSSNVNTVFSSLKNNWTVYADQSSAANFINSDLCIAQGVANANGHVSFTLQHCMGLMVGIVYYNPAGFSGNVAYGSGSNRYFIMKPSTSYTIGGKTLSVGTGQFKEVVWKAQDTAVDLGLPSGLKWAAGNVGTNNPQDYGLYFAWGETTGYTQSDVTSGVRAFDDATYQTGSAASISADLTLEQDAARANLGGNWRMPTQAEFQELIDNCTSEWTTDYNGTGVRGRLFTSKVNGNSVFFPTTGSCNGSTVGRIYLQGLYWSASWNSSSGAWSLNFSSGTVSVYSLIRRIGQPVRGVCK